MIQGQDQRHEHGEQGDADARNGDCLGTHRRHHPRLAPRRQARGDPEKRNAVYRWPWGARHWMPAGSGT